MTAEDHCVAQLQRRGIDTDEITHIVQTHLHMDHTGALGHFPNATVIVHQRELEAALGAEPFANGYVRADFARDDVDWQPIAAEEITARTVRGITRNRPRNRASNILLHDGGQKGLGQPRLPTVEATRLLLEKYSSHPETKFVTIDSWAQ